MSTTNYRNNEREAAAAKAKALKKKRRRKKTVATLVVVSLIAVVTLCILSLTVFFKIESINVVGNSTYTAAEVLSAAKISQGDNLILVNGKRINEKLSHDLPFIDSVKVEKTFPSTVKLVIVETREELCFVNDNNCYSANVKGKIIKKYDLAPENLIKITISSNAEFASGEKIMLSNERENNLYNDYINMIQSLDYKVNFINISDPFTSYMKVDDRIIVKFGSSSYFEDKVAYFKASLAGVSNTAEGVFDLSAWTPDNNQPVFTYGDISSYEK